MDCNDILIKCYGRNFVKDKAFSDQVLTLEELIMICETLYYENESLKEKLNDLEENLQENYIPKNKSEQYGISDSDFI